MQRQSLQIRSSDTYNDELTAGETLEQVTTLEGDLNALRSQHRRLSGETAWFDAPSGRTVKELDEAVDALEALGPESIEAALDAATAAQESATAAQTAAANALAIATTLPAAIEIVADALEAHEGDFANPHAVTRDQIGAAATTTQVIAGHGLTGGGALTSHVTMTVQAADASIAVSSGGVRVGALQSDAQHGTLGGGTNHAVATDSAAGFMSAAQAAKLDALSVTANRIPIVGDGWDGPATLNGAMTNDISLFSSAITTGDVTPRASQQAAVIRVAGTFTINHTLSAAIGAASAAAATAGVAGATGAAGGAGAAGGNGSASLFALTPGTTMAGGVGGSAALNTAGTAGVTGAAANGLSQGGAGGGGGAGGSSATALGGAGGAGGSAVAGVRHVSRAAAWVQCPESFAFASAFSATVMGAMGGAGAGGAAGGGGAGGTTGAGGIGKSGLRGGSGGGGWQLTAEEFAGTGIVRANGAAGTSASTPPTAPAAGGNGSGGGGAGGGGGGGAGLIVVRAWILGDGLTFEANGGAGGTGSPGSPGDGTGTAGGAGGNGGDGFAGQVWIVMLA